MKKLVFKIILFVILLITSFFVGSYYKSTKIKETLLLTKQIRAKNNNYPLVNRLIGTEMPSAITLGFYKDIKNDIENILSKEKYKGTSHFSLYYRDLNTGLWFGINENEEYVPASLFKVPIAITYFRHSIDNKNLFNSYFEYTTKEINEINSIQNLEQSSLVLGQRYSVIDLLNKMLIDSDNGAQRVLANNIDQNFLNKLYSIIEVDGPEQNHYYISPKEYAFFLRMLYNGSYLGLEKSEQLLEILSKTNFQSGIKNGVPSDITVIHKFGSVNFVNKSTQEKMIGVHDCGIIYHPDKPYILCIMTQGDKQETEINEIEEVSKYIFNYINN